MGWYLGRRRPSIDGVGEPGETDRWVLEPTSPPAPVVACLPHGGREFPDRLAGELAVSPRILWSDWLTRELYAFLPEIGVTTVTTGFSRFVADVNRDPASGHGGFSSSVVAARMLDGRPLYRRALTEAEVSHRVKLAHEPFHRALDTVVERLLRRFPAGVLLLDLHSFGRQADGDVILGDRHGTTARPASVRALSDAFAGRGLRVLRNVRYPGGWTVRRFAGYPLVDAVQIELNQRCYLDLSHRRYPEAPPPGAFDATQRLLRRVLADDIIAPLIA
jgi:N-formylglutamate deformylase